MEAIKQVVRTPKNHEIMIKIPHYVAENDLVEIIILIKKTEEYKRKINMLKTAMKDKFFLNDLNEISNDFDTVDLEDWEK